MPARKKRTLRKTKVKTKKVKTRAFRKVKAKTTAVTPARGRFQIFDLQSMNPPVHDSSGRPFVVCNYSDGSQRMYSLDTIIKNRDSLVRIIGTSSVDQVIAAGSTL